MQNLLDNFAGRVWLAYMVKGFRRFVELADSHDIKLIVAVMTGWMSARLVTPPVLDDRNVLTDPETLM